MDPQLQALGAQLAASAIRNGATAIGDRITAIRARRDDKEIIAELEQIINDLLSDKNELVRISRAFEDELVSQRISESDVNYIVGSIIPVIEGLAGGNTSSAGQQLDAVKQLLSKETITVMQLLGFNFAKAIGEPLTELARSAILAKSPLEPATNSKLQALAAEHQMKLADVSLDPDAHRRFMQLLGRS